jgi:hypothetical protein
MRLIGTPTNSASNWNIRFKASVEHGTGSNLTDRHSTACVGPASQLQLLAVVPPKALQ